MNQSVELKLLEKTIIQCWHYLNRANNLGKSNDYLDVYFIIDYLSYAVEEAYPQIPCKSGCSMCCSDTGLPRVTQIEWVLILDYLKSEVNQNTLSKILKQNRELHLNQKSSLQLEVKRLKDPNFKEKPPDLNCKYCPFLIDNLCMVYPVRPSICRGFGYFSFRPYHEQSSTIFACFMAAETLLNSLSEIGIENVLLPVWNKISDKIFELNKLQNGEISLIPLYLFENEELLSKDS